MLTPAEAVDAINERFGRHHARALHAKGTVCKGRFTATPEAARLTAAAHMQGALVDATVRWSNGSGDPDSRDCDPDVRGMAVKFHLPDGSATDISSQTSPRFSTPTPDGFIELVLAARPGLAQLWRMPRFLATHPRSLAALRVAGPAVKPPTSYATCRYYALHAFKWLDAEGGERYVRYRWLPEDEEPRLSLREARERGRDYLHDELCARLAAGPIRYTLELEIAAAEDDVDDPSKPWPDDRERVTAGTLEVTGVDDDAERDGEVLVFDPGRLTSGIEPSDDPVLAFRTPAYKVSVERRT